MVFALVVVELSQWSSSNDDKNLDPTTMIHGRHLDCCRHCLITVLVAVQHCHIHCF